MNKPRIADCISEDLWSILEVVGFPEPFLHYVIFLTLTCFKLPVTFVDYKLVLNSQGGLMVSSLATPPRVLIFILLLECDYG